ncbi:serine hydrolase [Bacillus tropicus]|uniref:serine hydrolase n=1 Tax=Bacillus tropicus TaxID=2026188 RepID=UPI00065B9F48|nr:serine hydrolase [Bacillus tropicus]KMQ00967.1 hypothetical protein TU68_26840 [Bacillus cereus]
MLVYLSGKGWLNEPVEVTNQPGSETIYSGGGYTILQLVMEGVTGIPFDCYMEEQIYLLLLLFSFFVLPICGEFSA